MEDWVKIGVQHASVLYPNSCYNELCYIKVQVKLDRRLNIIKYKENSSILVLYLFPSHKGSLRGVICSGLYNIFFFLSILQWAHHHLPTTDLVT